MLGSPRISSIFHDTANCIAKQSESLRRSRNIGLQRRLYVDAKDPRSMHRILLPASRLWEYDTGESGIDARTARNSAPKLERYNRSRGHLMSYVLVIWTVWGALALVLLGLILYRATITRAEEDQLFLEDAPTMQHQEQDLIMKRVKPIENLIRIFGGVEGLVTLGILAFYLTDALRQF
jgi:hypothetical protein